MFDIDWYLLLFLMKLVVWFTSGRAGRELSFNSALHNFRVFYNYTLEVVQRQRHSFANRKLHYAAIHHVITRTAIILYGEISLNV